MVEEENMNLYALVNNAGIQILDPIENTSIEAMREVFDVNVFGLHCLTKAFIPLLRKNSGSRIINIGSVSGLISSPYMGAYCASKHAVEAYSDSLRVELRPFGVYVTCIEPGGFKTPLLAKNFNDENAQKDSGIYTHSYARLVNATKSINCPSSKWIADQLERVICAR